MGNINFLELSYKYKSQDINAEKVNAAQINELVIQITDDVVSEHADIIKKIKIGNEKKDALSNKIVDILDKKTIVVSGISRDELIKKVLDEVFGYSIVQKYIDDKEVNDIMVNKYDCIYIRKNQTDIKVEDKFASEEAYMRFLYKVAAFCGQKLNASSPQVDGSDDKFGLRINITMDPVNTYDPSLIVRKGHNHFTIEELHGQGNLSDEMLNTFKIMAVAGSRVMFVGQLESGKTTFMNSYLNLIPYRTVIMEDTPELFTENSNTVYQRTTKSTTEDGLNITLADLVKNFRRTNGQHPVVGEVRGPEAVELLDIFNTGFIRGASSLHANSARDSVNQLIFQIKASEKLGTDKTELEEYIGRTIDMIVYMEKRKVIEMVEVDYDYDNRNLIFNTLHNFMIESEDKNNVYGHFENCINPYSKKMKDRIRRAGLTSEVPENMMK